jgi:hypothetical protein
MQADPRLSEVELPLWPMWFWILDYHSACFLDAYVQYHII